MAKVLAPIRVKVNDLNLLYHLNHVANHQSHLIGPMHLLKVNVTSFHD